MFFTVSRLPDPRLPEHKNIGTWWFSHDAGWSCNGTEWSKGYIGNHLHIKWNNNQIQFEHDLTRCFPLWWDKDSHTLTNFLGSGQRVWADKTIAIVDGQLVTAAVDIVGEINSSALTMNQAVDTISRCLIQKAAGLLHPSKLFVTGGVDTLTLLALVKHVGLPCQLLDYEHFEYDEFTNQNIIDLRKQHWAYNQIHHWREPTTLISGAYGDEFLFRGPHNIALWAAWHDIDLIQLLKSATGYHVGYFRKPENKVIFCQAFNQRADIKAAYPTYTDLVRKIIDTNANDFQHCHLGNTITWTPFKDPELTKIVLRLNQQDLLDHILDATVNRQIIARLYPTALNLLSATKNQDSRQYLHMLNDI
jgi:hypothetical protein